MKNVFTIFFNDIKVLSKHFFAMAIIIAITVIPALYAWFNIFANWDPYGNTGNIKIAAASDDKGYNDLDGNFVNKGEVVLDSLREKDSINFVIYDNSDDALRAMESGECYAAIILHEDFTKNMYDIASALVNPDGTITFYENYKLNAVANKITETAASTVSQTVQEEYLQTLYEMFFAKISDTISGEDIESTGNKTIDILTKLRETCVDVSEGLEKFQGSADRVAEKLGSISTYDTAASILETKNGVDGSEQTIESVRESYRNRSKEASELIDDIINRLSPKVYTGEFSDEEMAALQSDLMTLDVYGNDISAVSEGLGSQFTSYTAELLADTDAIEESGNTSPEYLIQVMVSDLQNLQKLQNEQINDAIEQLFTGLINLSNGLSPVLASLATTVETITPTMQAASETIYALDDTLYYVKLLMDSLTESLDKIIDKVEALTDSETMQTIDEMLSGDSDEFAKFFACPVTVKTETVYPVADYGTAMAPFYSTLAVWVGCVVLAAIIKVEADPRDLKNATENQLFWARFLLYLILNELQTLIIVLGDLYLLKITCLDPVMFWFAMAFTSFVFTCFIFSLVLAFGDVGKAIVVVIMVLQIAGSSGTYPIEILQGIFGKLYLLFPFPYAINAEREAICGYYKFDYWQYLAELSVFAIVGLAIGLYARRPFIKVNRYVEEEMEETGVL